MNARDDQDFKTTDEAIPKDHGYFIYCIIGGRGRGKSTILLNLLNGYLKQYYNNIYFCSTTAKRDPKFEKLIEELEDEDHFYDSFSDTICSEIMEKLIQNIEEKETRNLIILDDVASMIPASTEKNSSFNKLIMGSRHYKTDIILTSQCFNKLNTIVRKNLDIISLFSTVNKKELTSYTDELNVDKDQFLNYLDLLEGKHEFLTISFLHGNPVFFKNFDKIVE
jgi:hypothetical protein